MLFATGRASCLMGRAVGRRPTKERRMADLRDLFLTTPHKSGPDVKKLQQALNQRLKARGFATIDADGDYGADTASAVRRVGYMLGALEPTLDKGAPVGLQQMIIDPSSRTKAQLDR